MDELSPDEMMGADRVARRARRGLPRQTLIFAGIVLAALALAGAVTTSAWLVFVGRAAWPGLVALVLLAMSFVPISLLTYRHDSPWLHFAYRPAALALSFLNYTTIAALACWLIALTGFLTRTAWRMPSIALGLFSLAALVAVAGWINAAWIRTTRVTVALKKLPREWHGRKVAVVSDVHLGNLRRARFVARLVRRLNHCGAEAVLIVGDMFDGTAIDPVSAAAPWSELTVPRGAFFVTGNHDEFSDREVFIRALSAAGVRVLNNEKIVLDELQIAGVHDGETHHSRVYAKILGRLALDPARPTILLAHQPSRLKIPEQAGVALQVSGHTHGGQFWPWTHIARRVHGPFVYGLHEFGRMQVLTSSGVGTWGPPIRVGTRAEFVLIKLVRAA